MGKLVVFEGIDGAGTEEQSKRLLEFLKNQGKSAERIYYPDYGGPVGNLIHEYLHKKFELSLDMQFLLYAGDMVKDREKIAKLLQEGKTVIADRYFTSTIAYQGLGGFPIEKALEFAGIFQIPKPDIIIYLKVSPETSIKRKFKEKNSLDRNEENKEFLGQVGKFYDDLIEKQIFGKWIVINGEKPKEEVFGDVRKVLGV
jgi:dTMP kinase